jgi:hypothetical protein
MMTATQAYGTGLSELLFIQRPEMLYIVVGVMAIVGLAFWFLGHQIHRVFIAVLFSALGFYVGWEASGYYGLHGLHVALAMLGGGLLGAGLGYWVFRFWLGLFASGLIALLLLGLYSWKMAVPYLAEAAGDSRQALMEHGIDLTPGNKADRPEIPPAGSHRTGPGPQARKSQAGQAYQSVQSLLPKLSRAQYPDWSTWRTRFPDVAGKVLENLQVILPGLKRDFFLVCAVGLVVGLVLAGMRPVFLDIAYTSLLGILLCIGGVILVVTLKDTRKLGWIGDNALVSGGTVTFLWLVGVAVQYYMIPPPPPPPEESEEEEDAPEKDKGGKKKK